MADIQREIDEIRAFMDSNELTASERVRHAAAAYASACQEANRRLSRCAELLHKGLRGEAIHQAQTDPALLELTAMLDFPDSEKWIGVASSYDLPAPPRLSLKLAEELNQAYAQEKPLEELMKTHRLLALARAGLRERIPVLRRIAEVDNLNPVWDDDIRLYEKARLKELSNDFQSALKANDDDRLLDLQDEIVAPGWRESIPLELASKIATRSMKIDNERVARRFAKLESALNEAVSSVDLKAARACRERIIAAVSEERVLPDNPLVARLQPGLDWLDRKEKAKARQDKFDAAFDQFKADLRANRPFAELQEQYRKLIAFDERIPRETEDAYYQLEHRQRRAQLLKRVLITAAILIVVGGSAVGGVLWLTERSLTKKTDEARTKLDALMNAESYSEARGYIEDLARREPQVADALDVRSVTRKLDDIEKARQDRSKGFSDALRKAEELPAGDPYEQASIDQLRRLAATPSEKASAALYADKREALRKKRTQMTQDKTENALHRQLIEFETELQAVRLKTYDRALLDESRHVLIELNKRLQSIEAQAADLGSLIKDAAATRAKFAGVEQTLDQMFKEIEAIDAVTHSLNSSPDNIEAYSAALMNAAKAFTDAERRREFETAAAEKKTCDLLVAWEKALAETRSDYLSLNDAVKAETCAKQLSDLSERLTDELQNEGAPVPVTLVIEYIDALKATAAQPKAVEAIRTLFSREDVRGLYVLRSVDGKTYYMKDNPEEQVRKATTKGGAAAFIRYRPLRAASLGEADLFMKLADYKSHGIAPQSDLADKVLIDLRSVDQTGFDGLLKIIDERIRKAKELDPILAMILIRRLMESASLADTALARELQTPTKLIEDAITNGIDLNVPWFDPSRADSNRVRAEAAKFLAVFPSFKELPEAVRKRHAMLEKQLKQSRHKVAGWLHRLPDGGWKVVALRKLNAGTEMKVVAFKGDKPSGWVSIGKIKDGLPALGSDSPGSLMEGRLVFISAE